MKRIIISSLTVVMLVMMMLPATTPVVMGQGEGDQTASNETAINETATNGTATNETIESPLVADFDFSAHLSRSRGTRISVTFTDRSSGGVPPYTYDWDFGDSSNSTQENPRHRYASAGNYTVTLTVTDSVGNFASTSKTVTLNSAAKETIVELDSGISSTGGVVQSIAWPTAWTGLDTDDNENGCSEHRNVADINGDGYALYYDVDSQYIYLRMETVTAPGWPSTKPAGDARYKWWFNTDGTSAYISGTSVYNAEFLLILEDLTDNSNDPNMTRDLLGELTLMDDLNNDGFMTRWDSSKPPSYTINNAQTTPTGNSTLWRRELGTGTNGTGGPQGVMGADIGYRIDNDTTGGNFVDIYVSRAALGNPTSVCLIWATDNNDPNLDQAPNCDRPTGLNCIMLGKDYGDAPDPTYPTLFANDGARHTVNSTYCLGANIDAELDGIPNSTAMGDDNSNLDDEDGVVFTTALVRGQSANVTVTASAAGKLDAWVDFNDDGDWADAGEKIFNSQSLSAGANNLNFTVPFSATQTAQTFARFRFSSAGGLSYTGLADDGEVEDYEVGIEGCTLTVNLTGDTSFCEGSSTTITANVTGGASPYSYNWTATTAPGSAKNGSYNATGSGMVKVTVTDNNGCTGSANVTVTALQRPTADFSSNVTSCCKPLGVQFSDNSTAGSNPIVSWSWNFGDGTNSTAQNPSHTYNTAGIYNVTLTVTDSHGCSDTKTKTNYITSNQGPTADFSAIPTSGYAPLEVNFTDNSVAGSNNITDWYWEFGDGGTSTTQNPSHTYNNAGTYTVTLTVTDSHGCTDDATTNVVVTVPTPPAGGGAACCCPIDTLTVDWEGCITSKPLYTNDCLVVDLLGPSTDLSHNLFLEHGTHAPVVDGDTYYLIVVRELEEIPALPENTTAIVVFDITPAGAEFNRDIFLTLGLDESQLPENALNVTMAYYDDVNEVWVAMDYEAGGPSGVAELTLSAPINHFSIYGILAELAPTPPQPAHFVASGLNIVPSVEKTIFVTRTGESVTIAANIANDGGQEGTYTVVLKLNGETVDTRTVTLDAGQSQQVSFTRSGLDYGQYDVEVAGLSGEFTTSRTITWWLIILIIVAIGLIIWGVVWGRRRKRKAAQEG